MSFEAAKARHKLAWGMGVEGYAKHSIAELAPVADRLVEIADPPWDGSVIDIGCGPGTATLRAALRVGPGGHVLGVDLAPQMVAWAERRAQAEHLPQVRFLEGDAEALEGVDDAKYDVAISNFGVIFAPDGARMVGTVARVLKPGGVFAFSTWIERGIAIEQNEFLAAILPLSPEGSTLRDSWGDPDVARERMAPHFDDVSFTEVDVACDFVSVDDAWTRMRDGRPPFALAYGRMAVHQKQEVEEKARELFRRHADEDGRVHYVRNAAVVRGIGRA
ncbi:MAG: class I SAM-dependent methyltransferase [Candidatus Eisenbacteria bacterium]